MMRKGLAAALGTTLVLAAGCAKKQPQQKPTEGQAIVAAIDQYLASRPGINRAAMDMQLRQFTIGPSTADVTVEFRAKEGGPGMQMTYHLARQGDGWIVKSSESPSGATHPPVGAGQPLTGTTDLPPGHPPLQSPEKTPAPPKKN